MKDGLTQVKELKDKIHEQYMEMQELNKARKFDIEYNKHLQKEIIRLNNIINKAINILELSAMNKGICTRPETDTIQSALLILKGENNE